MGSFFDLEFGGVGAGQLVQGTNNAFDDMGAWASTEWTLHRPHPTVALREVQEIRVSGGVTVLGRQYFNNTEWRGRSVSSHGSELRRLPA